MSDLFGDDSDEGESLFSVLKPKTKKDTQKPKEEQMELPQIFTNQTNQNDQQHNSKSSEPIKEESEPPQNIEQKPEVIETTEEINEIEESNHEEEIVEKPKRKKIRRRKILPKISESVEESPILKFKNEIQQRFEELELEIDSLQNSQNTESNYRYITFPRNKVLEHVKAVHSNLIEKDEKLSELQTQIDNLSSHFCEPEEKKILQQKINNLNKEIELLQNSVQEKTDIENEILSLEKEIENINLELQSNEQKQREDFNKKTEKMIQKIIAQNKEIQENLTLIESSKTMMIEEISRLQNENKKLKEESEQNNESEELKLFKQQRNTAIQKVIQQLAASTYSMIEENVDEETSYSGKMCVKAIQSALQIAGENILNPDDDEEEEEEEET